LTKGKKFPATGSVAFGLYFRLRRSNPLASPAKAPLLAISVSKVVTTLAP